MQLMQQLTLKPEKVVVQYHGLHREVITKELSVGNVGSTLRDCLKEHESTLRTWGVFPVYGVFKKGTSIRVGLESNVSALCAAQDNVLHLARDENDVPQTGALRLQHRHDATSPEDLDGNKLTARALSALNVSQKERLAWKYGLLLLPCVDFNK